MTVRHGLILAVIAVAIGPLCLLAFSGGHAAPPDRSPSQETRSAAAAGVVPRADGSVDAGCVDRALAYGLTDDQAVGERYDRDFLSPFAAHPPLPRAGYYAPGHAPDQAALLHALYHGYVVVRYRQTLADVVRGDLRRRVARASEPVLLVSGRGMPFAVGALVYGRTSICGTLNRTTTDQLTAWIEKAGSRPARP
jgi:hypothetical protein